MKNELAFDEIKRELKKLHRKSSSKTILFIIIGIVAVGLAAVLFIIKIKDKLNFDAEDYDDDDEYVYYGDEDDEDDYYEDYRALDYEDEEE